MNAESLKVALAPVGLVRRFYFFEDTDSTMTQARRIAGEGAARDHHGTLVVANYQAAGRGRHGRQWQAPAGQSLLATLIYGLEATAGAEVLSQCAAAMPVGLCEGLGELVPGVRIKFPNDLVIGGSKMAGILLERVDGALLIGFGVNCHQEISDFPAELRMPATSILMETGRRVPRERVLVSLMEGLDRAMDTGRRAESIERMNALCETLGHGICLDLGDRVITGEARRINADGTLTLRTERGDETIFSSQVVRTWPMDASYESRT